MPPFRERLGTGCTKDSKDSGIDVRPRAKRHRRRMENLKARSTTKSASKKKDDNDDVKQRVENMIVFGMWGIVLYFTNLTFGLPFEIMWPVRVNHLLVALSYIMVWLWSICATYGYVKFAKRRLQWSKHGRKTFYIGWGALILGSLLFYNATFPQLHYWSLLIITFYMTFFINIHCTFF